MKKFCVICLVVMIQMLFSVTSYAEGDQVKITIPYMEKEYYIEKGSTFYPEVPELKGYEFQCWAGISASMITDSSLPAEGYYLVFFPPEAFVVDENTQFYEDATLIPVFIEEPIDVPNMDDYTLDYLPDYAEHKEYNLKLYDNIDSKKKYTKIRTYFVPMASAPSRKGYLFDGWYTKPKGGEREYEGAVIHSNMSLYAHWKKVKVKGSKLYSVKKLKGKKIKVIYKILSSVSGYEIQYSTDKSMKKNSKSVLVYYYKDSSKTIKVKKKGKYYVRVRAYKEDSVYNKIYGKWSGVKSIKVK